LLLALLALLLLALLLLALLLLAPFSLQLCLPLTLELAAHRLVAQSLLLDPLELDDLRLRLDPEPRVRLAGLVGFRAPTRQVVARRLERVDRLLVVVGPDQLGARRRTHVDARRQPVGVGRRRREQR